MLVLEIALGIVLGFFVLLFVLEHIETIVGWLAIVSALVSVVVILAFAFR